MAYNEMALVRIPTGYRHIFDGAQEQTLEVCEIEESGWPLYGQIGTIKARGIFGGNFVVRRNDKNDKGDGQWRIVR